MDSMGIMLVIILDYMAIHHQHLSTMIWESSHITLSAPWQIIGMENLQKKNRDETKSHVYISMI